MICGECVTDGSWGKFLGWSGFPGSQLSSHSFHSSLKVFIKWPPGNRKHDASSWVCRDSVHLKAKEYQTSLAVQWIRIHLLMETWVQAVVQEDPTCHGATKPMRPNCWACALGLSSCDCWACVPQLLKLSIWSLFSATREAAAVRSPHATTKSSPCSHN